MYQPPLFAEDSVIAQHGLIRAFPLGLLVTHGASGLIANAIPFQIDPEAGEKGVLRCHVARANTQWKEIGPGADALVVFQGAQHYVHPGWYETKRETGKVVPTWNYTMVQVRGHARVMDDGAWLAKQIRDLTEMMEGAYPKPWAVDDAPVPFIEAQMRGIVGIEITISEITGKWKVSQNRSDADREGVIEGLATLQDEEARAMSALVAEAFEKKHSGGTA
jgi:transcriptional regulator